VSERARELFAARDLADRGASYEALEELFRMTERPVGWAYEYWDRLLGDLTHRGGDRRAFAAQMLSRLAISDPDGRMLEDFPRIAAVMKDEKTVSARHTLQSIWRVALAGAKQKEMVLDALETRFRECTDEKNCTLVRTDVVIALARLSKATDDETVEARVGALIEAEPDEKQRKKQRAAWRKAIR